MKRFEGDHLLPHQHSFNYAVLRTQRVVEQVNGRLKRRRKICAKSVDSVVFVNFTSVLRKMMYSMILQPLMIAQGMKILS